MTGHAGASTPSDLHRVDVRSRRNPTRVTHLRPSDTEHSNRSERRLRGDSATRWCRCYAVAHAAEPEVQRKCLIDGRGLSALWFCLDKHQTDAVWILDGCPSPQSGDIAGFRSDDSSEVGCDSGRSIKVGDANVRSPRWCVR
jgi:hypothetical protein